MRAIKMILTTMAIGMLLSIPTAFAAEKDGWIQEDNGWRYYENGVPLNGVVCIAKENNHRYVFDEYGFLMTGDAEGDVLRSGNLYYINPEKILSDPASCYAVTDYERRRDAGVTYYDRDGITFVGWMNTADGGRMYQTLLPKEKIGADKNLYIYVWRAQDLLECPNPDYPGDASRNIPAGRYLFGDNSVLIEQVGWHDCNDGKAYRTDAQGRILEERPINTTHNPQSEQSQSDTLPVGKVPLERARGTGRWEYINEGDETYTAVQAHINALRAEEGAAPLVLDEELSRIAAARVKSFADGGPYDHSGMEDFPGWEYRNEIICGGGYVDGRFGMEGVGQWYTAESVVQDAWHSSSGHYNTLMAPIFTRMGVGCTFKAEPLPGGSMYSYKIYWAVVFEQPAG